MNEPTNPWITRQATPADAHDGSSPAAPAVAPRSGPTAPQGGVSTPDVVDRLPRRRDAADVVLWWVGAHGGAGETTLSTLLPGSRPAQHAWPTPLDGQAHHRVVLTARTHMSGLLAAQLATTDWASGAVPGVELLGLVLSADAPGRLPRQLRDFAAVVAGGAPRVWHLPWLEPWRLGQTAPPDSLSRPARQLLTDLRTLTPSSSPAVVTTAVLQGR